MARLISTEIKSSDGEGLTVIVNRSSRLLKTSVDTLELRGFAHVAQEENILTGCSKRLSSKAAVSEDRRRTLWGTLRI
jgi:hypothetical protein